MLATDQFYYKHVWQGEGVCCSLRLQSFFTLQLQLDKIVEFDEKMKTTCSYSQ